jgi:sec-independent protein translocase protein TatC
VFETPILIFFLARFGIVTPAFLMQKSRYAIVIAFVISAIVTPTPDWITCTALALPMIGLYYFGVLISWMFAKKIA